VCGFCQVPGRSRDYSRRPPQTRTWRFPSSGSSVLIAQKPNRRQPRLAHDICCPVKNILCFDCFAIRVSFVDTVCELNVSPVVPLSRVSCPASPSLQWVPWASVPHLLATIPSWQHRYYALLRLPLPFPVGSLFAPFRYLSNMPLVCFPHSFKLRIAHRWTCCL